MATQANEMLKNFKDNGWVRSANLSARCYVQHGKSNETLNDFIYKTMPSDIFEGKDGEYLFIFADKSAICFDGNLFEEMDDHRATQVFGCEGHEWVRL